MAADIGDDRPWLTLRGAKNLASGRADAVDSDGSSGLTGAAVVLAAFAIDALCGEPPARWHPVVWAGRALAATGAPWAGARPRQAFARGAAVWMVGALMSIGAAALAVEGISSLIAHTAAVTAPAGEPWWRLLRAALLGVLLKPLLAWQLLRDEVQSVDRALSHGLDEGRERLKSLVSRDTGSLTATEVRESALESLAENLNDSFVAPLFWFVVGGLPAAALYRFANTADAMWGYRGRWEWAGKWSARADDVLSFIPARFTALLLLTAACSAPRRLRFEAGKTPSPNGGWPMAALALAMDIRLSKPGVYTLHAEGRSAAAEDFGRGLRIATRAAWLAAALAMLLSSLPPVVSVPALFGSRFLGGP